LHSVGLSVSRIFQKLWVTCEICCYWLILQQETMYQICETDVKCSVLWCSGIMLTGKATTKPGAAKSIPLSLFFAIFIAVTWNFGVKLYTFITRYIYEYITVPVTVLFSLWNITVSLCALCMLKWATCKCHFGLSDLQNTIIHLVSMHCSM